MVELPTSVRYVKNGAGGRWWPDAKASSRIHAGWKNIPDELIRSGDAAAIRPIIQAEFGAKQGATQDFNALLTLLDRPSRHIWITFEAGFMWWATAQDGVTVAADGETDDLGHFWLTLDRPWSNTSLAKRLLATSELPGVVMTTAGFKATVCKPKGAREVLRLIRDEPDTDAAAALAARLAYQAAVGKLVSRLRWKDFEALADLILARSGWTRLGKLGGTVKSIDMEVENPATAEIAFVQVKSEAGQAVLADYVEQFHAQRDRYDRMIFVVHSPQGALVAPPAEPVQVWNRAKVAELVVRLGLGDWVAKRL